MCTHIGIRSPYSWSLELHALLTVTAVYMTRGSWAGLCGGGTGHSSARGSCSCCTSDERFPRLLRYCTRFRKSQTARTTLYAKKEGGLYIGQPWRSRARPSKPYSAVVATFEAGSSSALRS
eukprot:6046263-Prymnesium_polylepis.2